MTATAPRPVTHAHPHLPDGNGVTSEWITLINARSYHYVTAGPADAPPLVFLHGYTDSWRSAELLLPHLAGPFRVIALDQRGHGASDFDFERFSIDDFAADAADFIEHVVGGPVTLVGHSLGSLVAQRLAARHPALVARLVLIGSADTAGGNPALAELVGALRELGERIPYAFARDFQASTVARPLAPAQLETFVQESLRLRPVVWRKVAAALLNDAAVVAGSISAPTLLLWGEQDGVFDAAAQDRLQALLRQVRRITYPGIGHAPHWEAPEQVARDILAFSRQ
jgi:pimeloyl-ACP methyl ester carboxylesterase